MARLCGVLVFLFWRSAANGQDDPERLLRSAIALQQAGDIERAIPQYRAYLKLRPDAVEPRSNLGVALARSGRYNEAITEYREALGRRPGDPTIRLNLALALYHLAQFTDAASELSSLHKEQPANQQVILLLADCWLRKGENRRVIDMLSLIESSNQGDLAIAYLLGMALLRDNQVDRGQSIIDRILRNGDSAEARLLLGTAKLTAQDYDGAIADLRQAAELNSQLRDVHSYLGQAYIQTGDTAEARSAFQKELALNPNDFESNLQLGALLKQDQDFDGARLLLQKALLVRPGDLRTRYQLASVNLAAGKLDEARLGFEAILRQAPQFVEAHISLATAYYRLNRKADGDREKALAQKLTLEQRTKPSQEKME